MGTVLKSRADVKRNQARYMRKRSHDQGITDNIEKKQCTFGVGEKVRLKNGDRAEVLSQDQYGVVVKRKAPGRREPIVVCPKTLTRGW